MDADDRSNLPLYVCKLYYGGWWLVVGAVPAVQSGPEATRRRATMIKCWVENDR